jgi:hypothetical protein
MTPAGAERHRCGLESRRFPVQFRQSVFSCGGSPSNGSGSSSTYAAGAKGRRITADLRRAALQAQ